MGRGGIKGGEGGDEKKEIKKEGERIKIVK